MDCAISSVCVTINERRLLEAIGDRARVRWKERRWARTEMRRVRRAKSAAGDLQDEQRDRDVRQPVAGVRHHLADEVQPKVAVAKGRECAADDARCGGLRHQSPSTSADEAVRAARSPWRAPPVPWQAPVSRSRVSQALRDAATASNSLRPRLVMLMSVLRASFGSRVVLTSPAGAARPPVARSPAG